MKIKSERSPHAKRRSFNGYEPNELVLVGYEKAFVKSTDLGDCRLSGECDRNGMIDASG